MTMNFYTATPLWAVLIVNNGYANETSNVDDGFNVEGAGCEIQIFSSRHLADAWANERLEEDQDEEQRAIVCQFTPSHIMQWQMLVTTESCEPAIQPTVPKAKRRKTPAPEQVRGRRLDLSE